MTELKILIELAQSGNEKSMLDIIYRFEPLIKKYYRKTHNDEDFKSDMVLELIQIINKINFELFYADINDAVLVKYITSSLYHSYIKLLKKYFNEYAVIYDDILLNMCLEKDHTEDFVDKLILSELLDSILNKREISILKYIFLYDYSISEIAAMLGVSRQAVNQSKNRALHKLKKYI